MSNSILIMGIDWNYIDKISQKVADKLGKMFLSIHDLIIYEMQGIIGDVDNIDKDYVDKQIENAKIKALSYKDSIISVDVTNLNSEKFEKLITKLPKIYVQNNNNDGPFSVIYEDRDRILKEIVSFVVSAKDLDAQVEEIVEIIKKVGK